MTEIDGSIYRKRQLCALNDISRALYGLNRRGVMSTHGTGFGKTFLGKGTIDLLRAAGERRVLIVCPTSMGCNKWKRTLGEYQIESEIVERVDEKPMCTVSITTYSNLAQNIYYVDVCWGLVILDESHRIMSNASGNSTQALRMFRALTGHPKGLSDREAIQGQSASVREKHERQWSKIKVLFLSATPWAYHKDLDYSEGYLFEYATSNDRGYNTPSPREAFLIDHFGYRMRCGRLASPDVDVDISHNERRFGDYLRDNLYVIGEPLATDRDYSRQFVQLGSELSDLVAMGSAELDDSKYKYGYPFLVIDKGSQETLLDQSR